MCKVTHSRDGWHNRDGVASADLRTTNLSLGHTLNSAFTNYNSIFFFSEHCNDKLGFMLSASFWTTSHVKQQQRRKENNWASFGSFMVYGT